MSAKNRYTLCVAAWLLLISAIFYRAENMLTAADAFCYTAAGRLLRAWPDTDYAQLHRPGQPVQQEQITLRRPLRHCPPVHYIAWNAGSADAGEPPLPKQQELATLLHCLATKLGVRSVAISCPLDWEDEQGEMAGHMLIRALGEFRHVGVGIAGRSAARSSDTPELLRPAIIPPDRVQGDTTTLLSANTPLPYSLPPEPELITAPDYTEDEHLLDHSTTRGLSHPLLLRWNGRVLATLPLRLALAQLGLTTADVHVRMGKTLRLGDRVLPLDAHGRTPLGAARAEPLPPEEALTAYMPLPPEAQQCAVLCYPHTPGAVDERAARLAATLSQLLSGSGEELMPTQRIAGGRLMEHALVHTSLTGRLGSIALLLGLLLLLPRLSLMQRTVVHLALLGLLIAAAAMAAAAGAWLSLCAWLLCWLLLIPAAAQLSRCHSRPAPTLW